MRKGEIACYKQFLLFSQCFPQLHTFTWVKVATKPNTEKKAGGQGGHLGTLVGSQGTKPPEAP